ncbi:MAG: HPr family phosphocarrier protein [Rhodospirillales bacterium CG15_BIG_FIL_POST_REV_8_21_14_020_66_15]|nr:MAG: HPr family phosphocarrier protein [Rhodospirillales bacterium CG15_BIG_FIL_POST_REV_8_21_14_020_66_15]
MPSRTVTIVNMRGLHARAAAKFAKLASEFEAEILVSKDGQTVGGRSIMGLMMLAAAPGTEIEIACDGTDGAEALEALAALVEGGFDEDRSEGPLTGG